MIRSTRRFVPAWLALCVMVGPALAWAQEEGGGEAAAEAAPAEEAAAAGEPAAKAEEEAGPSVTEQYKSIDSAAVGEEERRKREEEAQMQAHKLRLKTLERRVAELKEQVFKSKARLSLLAETVISGALTGAKAVVYHVNEMGSMFEINQIVYSLDGAPIFSKTKEDGLETVDRIKIFDAAMVPGDHTLSVRVEYAGKSGGLFNYVAGYKWNLKQSFSFQAQEGKVVKAEIVGYERGGLTTQLKDKPALRANIQVRDTLDDESAE